MSNESWEFMIENETSLHEPRRRTDEELVSACSNHKLWAAKFVARHPNLISVELSNFKCGHDAFISRIVEKSGKPHFSFRDMDEIRPLASIRIRIETMDYFLKRYRGQLRGAPESRWNAEYGMHFEPGLAHSASASVQGWALI